MTMQLKSLSIRRPERYEPEWKEGRLMGKIAMDGLHSEVAVKLSDEQCRAILTIVGQAAKETTQAAVEAMTAEVFNLPSTALIEG